MKAKKIVLTGGPCAGKTSALSYLTDELEDIGYRVLCVPEAATLLFSSGVSRTDISNDIFYFQKQLIKLQMSLEDTFINMAQLSKDKCVIICDRGTMDGSAYTPKDIWHSMLDDCNWSETYLRDRRYDAVIHLTTTAKAAESFYSSKINEARVETLEQAIEVDNRLLTAWSGHPKLRVINNRGDFSEKLKDLKKVVFNIIGVPEPYEIEKKYIVELTEIAPHFDDQFIIEQYYIKNDSVEERIRKRTSVTDSNRSSYSRTIKIRKTDSKCVEEESRLTAREFYNTLNNSEILSYIKKKRSCILYNDRYYELDEFIEPNKSFKILEIELESEDEVVNIPPYFKLVKDVTGDPSYNNSNMAKII